MPLRKCEYSVQQILGFIICNTGEGFMCAKDLTRKPRICPLLDSSRIRNHLKFLIMFDINSSWRRAQVPTAAEDGAENGKGRLIPLGRTSHFMENLADRLPRRNRPKE